MKKYRLLKTSGILLFFILALAAGCGKKENSKLPLESRKKILNEINSTYFFACNGIKYWQNFPGTCPDNNSLDMERVKDEDELNKIRQSILGLNDEVVYVCESDPQYSSNRSLMCPKCGRNMIKLSDFNLLELKKRLKEIESKLKGNSNVANKEIFVPNARCENCERLLEVALTNDKGILEATVDCDNQIAYIYYDNTKTNPENIENLILKAGFDVGDKKGSEDSKKYFPDCCK
jgi:copper chaperone CopZ